ncbi:hypothetical protein Q3O97_19780 [Ralstonia pseudosolanacearum]|uniref:Sel1 domain-containing protein n=1 Tax=Ralstonia solanacearum TaxID=305 RepID=A0A0S4V091_RALSL|nr:hypothetical protein [Ralstonia pseudosolanacearum]MDO3618087.1 hypothetical protein [Ralstonia pseudosolanacearum]CUV27653.1 Sel1 domain-containing protein [Ralstonia solanacearum]
MHPIPDFVTNTKATDPIEQAWQLVDNGDIRKAYELLAPLLAEGVPAAEFLYSRFSFSDVESIDQFEARSIRLLRSASAAGYAPALHALAVHYDMGDMVNRDPCEASRLFRAAAEAGHPKAMLAHGLDLFYGSNGMVKNEERGLFLVGRAADEGVEGAQEVFERVSAFMRKQ